MIVDHVLNISSLRYICHQSKLYLISRSCNWYLTEDTELQKAQNMTKVFAMLLAATSTHDCSIVGSTPRIIYGNSQTESWMTCNARNLQYFKDHASFPVFVMSDSEAAIQPCLDCPSIVLQTFLYKRWQCSSLNKSHAFVLSFFETSGWLCISGGRW